MVAYVMLSGASLDSSASSPLSLTRSSGITGLGLMPVQLLEVGTIIFRYFYQIFLTKTPRDYAELNSPSMVNLGVVYPQALLIWTLGLTYSVIMPVILPFTTIYFGLAYLVYKYRFLFVFCKSLLLASSLLRVVLILEEWLNRSSLRISRTSLANRFQPSRTRFTHFPTLHVRTLYRSQSVPPVDSRRSSLPRHPLYDVSPLFSLPPSLALHQLVTSC